MAADDAGTARVHSKNLEGFPSANAKNYGQNSSAIALTNCAKTRIPEDLS